jgi:hypothetical protein
MRTRFVLLVAAGWLARALHIAALLEKRLELALALEAMWRAVGIPAAPRWWASRRWVFRARCTI